MVNAVYYVVWTALLVGAAWVTLRWLMPFVLAFATAALLQRPLRWMSQRTHVPRGFLSGLLVALLVSAVAAAVGGVGWWLWRNAVTWVGNEAWINGVADRLAAAWETLGNFGERVFARLSPATQAALQRVIEELPTTEGVLGEWLREGAGWLARFAVGSLPSLLFSFFVWVLATAFLTGDFPRVVTFLRRCVPVRWRGKVSELRGLCSGTAVKIAKAYLVLFGVTFLELCVGLWLLRVSGALWLALLTALVDVLPVLGVGAVLLPWAAVTALTGEWRMAAWLLVLYLAVLLVRNVLEPRLISHRVGLPPSATLFFAYVGLRVAGAVGLLVAPLAAAVVGEMWRRKKTGSHE